MADPVAWKVIQSGWTVLDSAGEEVGSVSEVTGDPDADIFDGLAISKGILASDQYVPSEQVGEIREGVVTLKLSRAQVERLASFEEPAAEEQVLPESSTWYQRLAWWLTGRNR
jgi:sporulation protein YlmC with PRC-barrel domain